MTILALHDDPIPEGEFYGDAVVMGATREECIAALKANTAFAVDIGPSTREDGVAIYTMIGGSFR